MEAARVPSHAAMHLPSCTVYFQKNRFPLSSISHFSSAQGGGGGTPRRAGGGVSSLPSCLPPVATSADAPAHRQLCSPVPPRWQESLFMSVSAPRRRLPEYFARNTPLLPVVVATPAPSFHAHSPWRLEVTHLFLSSHRWHTATPPSHTATMRCR